MNDRKDPKKDPKKDSSEIVRRERFRLCSNWHCKEEEANVTQEDSTDFVLKDSCSIELHNTRTLLHHVDNVTSNVGNSTTLPAREPNSYRAR